MPSNTSAMTQSAEATNPFAYEHKTTATHAAAQGHVRHHLPPTTEQPCPGTRCRDPWDLPPGAPHAGPPRPVWDRRQGDPDGATGMQPSHHHKLGGDSGARRHPQPQVIPFAFGLPGPSPRSARSDISAEPPLCPGSGSGTAPAARSRATRVPPPAPRGAALGGSPGTQRSESLVLLPCG